VPIPPARTITDGPPAFPSPRRNRLYKAAVKTMNTAAPRPRRYPNVSRLVRSSTITVTISLVGTSAAGVVNGKEHRDDGQDNEEEPGHPAEAPPLRFAHHDLLESPPAPLIESPPLTGSATQHSEHSRRLPQDREVRPVKCQHADREPRFWSALSCCCLETPGQALPAT
jgi:hypothetical protein